MKKVLCIVTLVELINCLPLWSDTTAGFEAATSVEEGDIIEGDIILPKFGLARNLIRDESELWPNKVFPYKFGSEFNKAQKFNIETALSDLASQTCIKFRERTNEPTYIVFKSYGKICASVVGYTDMTNLGGEMPIYVSVPGCELRGKIQHEVLHSLGFWHEHTRPDRDEYVTVNWGNIKPGSESNFESRRWSEVKTLGLPYDYDSVMHYSGEAFSKDGTSTLTAKSSRPNLQMGQRFRVSKLDIAKLNRLYDCSDKYYKGKEIFVEG